MKIYAESPLVWCSAKPQQLVVRMRRMMKQREVTDKHNTTWTCVQAYAATNSAAAEKAAELSETDSGTVSVVCTPTGGAQTVRLELGKDWLDALSDEELSTAIAAAK